MSINKLSAVDAEKQEARKNYDAAKADYEREYCGFPFERLHVITPRLHSTHLLSFIFSLQVFFERVDELRKRLAKNEDVQFQSDCSIVELRRLVREHPPKEVRDCSSSRSTQNAWISLQVKRGLETLYKKIEKHLSQNSSLMQVSLEGETNMLRETTGADVLLDDLARYPRFGHRRTPSHDQSDRTLLSELEYSSRILRGRFVGVFHWNSSMSRLSLLLSYLFDVIHDQNIPLSFSLASQLINIAVCRLSCRIEINLFYLYQWFFFSSVLFNFDQTFYAEYHCIAKEKAQ